MTKKQFDEFVKEAYAELRGKIASTQSKYGLGGYDEFQLDQPTGRIVFFRAGTPKIMSHFQAVGSVSLTTNNWLWSWSNPHLLGSVKSAMEKVRQFVAKNRIAKLTKARWPATEADGWAMTAVSTKILASSGAYRCPSRNSYLFIVLRDIAMLDQETP